jgi:hypothetical protein
MDVNQLRLAIIELERDLASAHEDHVALGESLGKIDMDLANTQEEFVYTTGRDAVQYHPWRKKAKWARYHKNRAIEKKAEEVELLTQRLTDAKMLLLAAESSYLDGDAEGMCRAAYHLLMEILSDTGYTLSRHQLGLVAALRTLASHVTPQDVI